MHTSPVVAAVRVFPIHGDLQTHRSRIPYRKFDMLVGGSCQGQVGRRSEGKLAQTALPTCLFCMDGRVCPDSQSLMCSSILFGRCRQQ